MDLFEKSIQLLSKKEYTSGDLILKLKQHIIKNKFKTQKTTNIYNPEEIIREKDSYDLSQKEMNEIREIISKLKKLKYIDDENFIQNYAISQTKLGNGILKIKFSLLNKGLSLEQIDKILDAIDINWKEIAERTLQSKFGTTTTHKNFKEKIHKKKFMYQRGFRPSDIEHLI